MRIIETSPRNARMVKERFFSYVRKTSKCWIWVGGRCQQTKWGHGQFRIPGSPKRVQAHRFSYCLAGRSIPEGYCVHHICENPICVRPAHLKAMPKLDHIRHHIIKPCIHGNPKTYCSACDPANGEKRWQMAKEYRAARKAARMEVSL